MENCDGSGDRPPGHDLPGVVTEDSFWKVILAGKGREVSPALSGFLKKLGKVHPYGGAQRDKRFPKGNSRGPRRGGKEGWLPRTATLTESATNHPPSRRLDKFILHSTSLNDDVNDELGHPMPQED
ncbi:MAG: hypothetical protein ACLFVS_05220 [Candidatus Acetothermia bacterium]